jgi:transcriptional regulator with XRE-family HTH domain
MSSDRISAALRKMRERAGLSQREVGEKIGRSHVAVGAREREGFNWQEEDVDEYLAAIGATRQDLAKMLSDVRVTPGPTIPLIPSLASAGRYWVDRDDAQEYPDGTRQIPRGVHTTHPQAFAVPVEG